MSATDSNPKKRKILPERRGSTRARLLAGLLIILPVFVTFWIIKFAFTQIDNAITPSVLTAIELMGFGWVREAGWIGYTAPVVSVLVLVTMIYVIGLVGSNVLGRQLLALVDRMLRTIPVVKGIYGATRQFLDTFSTDGRAFSKVVLMEYPRKGLWTMGLLTNDTRGEVPAKTGVDLVSVFVPTTPNPTSGWLLFVPKEDVIELEMSVDDAFKMIISGGVLTPSFGGPAGLLPPSSEGPRALLPEETTVITKAGS